MKKIINVIHLSHTDIGYTDTQSRIIKNQINYLKDLVKFYSKNKTKFVNWKWTCESFFVVEKFLKIASIKEKDLFKEMVNKKIIGLSASYLNLAELANKDLYDSVLLENINLVKSEKMNMSSAICNDVNGFSIGYAESLSENNINNLFFGLHTHHGMFPAFKKQSPFWWEVGKGKKILVWVGEHYMMGNEIGLIDSEFGNYILQSDFESGYFDKKKQFSESRKRLTVYINNLKSDGYKFKNIPISVLGANTDNAPFNLTINKRIEELNSFYKKDDIEFRMVTIDEFFENIRNEKNEIPTYKGDWPDWWSDGTGSTPFGTRIFRQAQRNYVFIKDANIKSPLIKEVEENLMLYSEHTWGAWSSIENPFELWTQEISAIKLGFASNALVITNNLIDEFTGRKVHKLLNADKVILNLDNFNKSSLPIMINLNNYLSSKEVSKMKGGFEAKDNGNKLETFVYESKYMSIPQLNYYCIVKNPEKSKKVEITFLNNKLHKMTSISSTIGADGVSDVYNPLNNDEVIVHNRVFKNDFITMKWNNKEIYSLINNVNSEELLTSKSEGLFTPVFELCKIPYESEIMNLKRRWTGRNRKMSNFKKYVGEIIEVKILKESKEFTILEFFYEVEGTKYYKVKLEIANSTLNIAATIQIIKKVEWSLQNFYIRLPFDKDDDKILFDKGSMFEAWNEQLPGTLIDYYSIQEGIQIKKKNKNDVLISTPDNNLFWIGPTSYQKRFLAKDKRNKNKPTLYAWVMNTAWETNFNADISGFHEFKFNISLPKKNSDTRANLKLLNNIYKVTREF